MSARAPAPERSAQPGRWAWAEIDLAAIDHNVRFVRERVAPAAVWAVVKADGYGHGALDVAAQALRSGAAGLCVALVQEGVALRRAGIEAPILVLSEQPPGQLATLVEHRLTPTVYTEAGCAALATAAEAAGVQLGVHVKFDTGMQRVGAPPSAAPAIVAAVQRAGLEIEGVFTHLACADDPDHPANSSQLAAFAAVRAQLNEPADGVAPLLHAANSAAALALPEARLDLVRLGIAMYGISPGPGVGAHVAGLRPAMRLVARVSLVKTVRAGSHVSYGWRHRFDTDTVVATVPVGYADGVPRRLGTISTPTRGHPGADVLVGGCRCPIVGVVTMDQLMVDVGDREVAVGDEVVLIGEQGGERITATDWADRLGTIGYEIVCAVSARVPRIVSAPVSPSS